MDEMCCLIAVFEPAYQIKMNINKNNYLIKTIF